MARGKNKEGIQWELVKIDYIHQKEFNTLRGFCDSRSLNYGYVRNIAAAGKWNKERKAWQASHPDNSDSTDVAIYRDQGLAMLQSLQGSLLKSIEKFNDITKDPETFVNSEGKTSIIKYKRYLECQELLINNIKNGTLYMDEQTKSKIDIAYQQLELKKKRMNEDEGEILDDNFIDALEKASEAVWKEEE